jgi:hypothetical protein
VSDQFFLKKLPLTDKHVVIDHNLYYISDEESIVRGFGGARFTIIFDDGKVVTTTNLWHNGSIPSHLWDRFPNTAKFEKEWTGTYGKGHFVA